jgi:NAD(P)-dependent dehydrogenase (short-subunit alcohol dehydrogenase family)
MAKWTAEDVPDLGGKRALVTGAASGLGLEAAMALARHGAAVTLADRNVEGGAAAVRRIREQSPQARVEFKALDLSDLAFVRGFASEVTSAGLPLDILINNAGILPSLQRRTTRDGFELAFGIGHLGHFALTGLLLESLLRSPAPRVVSTSSLVQAYAQIDFDDLQAEGSYEAQRAYNQTKLATLMFALELQQRASAAGSRLISLAAHPGVARTPLGDARMREPPRRLRDRVERWAYNAMMYWAGQAADRGARPILYAATAPDAVGGGFYGPDGFQQFAGYPTRVKPSTPASDPVLRRRLWSASEELTGVRYHALR